MYISFRPFLFEMLERLKVHFELILFTAGFKSYAEMMVNEIQRFEKYFDHIISRENCSLHPSGKS